MIGQIVYSRGFNYLSSFLTLVMTFILVNGPLQHTRRTRSSIFTISRICIVIQLLAMAYSTYKRLIKVVQLVNKITITFCHLQGIFILEALLGKRPIVNDTAWAFFIWNTIKILNLPTITNDFKIAKRFLSKWF